VIGAVQAGVLDRLELPQVKFHCSFYADDVILFSSPTLQEAWALKQLLHTFWVASGLVANLNKCSITPILVASNEFVGIAHVLGCEVAEFPIKYLGLPRSSRTIPKTQLRAIVDSVTRRLPQAAHGPLLSRSGRLVWVKSVLTAVPLYAMMADHLPGWDRKEIEAAYRRFFWAGDDRSV